MPSPRHDTNPSPNAGGDVGIAWSDCPGRAGGGSGGRREFVVYALVGVVIAPPKLFVMGRNRGDSSTGLGMLPRAVLWSHHQLGSQKFIEIDIRGKGI
jgi:hypothetical protein